VSFTEIIEFIFKLAKAKAFLFVCQVKWLAINTGYVTNTSFHWNELVF